MKSARELENTLLDDEILSSLREKANTRGGLWEELGAPRKRLFSRMQSLVKSGDLVEVKNHCLKTMDGRYMASGMKEYLLYAKGKEDVAVESIIKSYPAPSDITSDTLKSIAHETSSYPLELRKKLMEELSLYMGRALPATGIPDEPSKRRHKGNTGPRDSYKHLTKEELDKEVLVVRDKLDGTPYSTDLKHLSYYIRKYHGTYGGLVKDLGLEPANRKV